MYHVSSIPTDYRFGKRYFKDIRREAKLKTKSSIFPKKKEHYSCAIIGDEKMISSTFFLFFFFFVCSSMRTLYTRSYNSLHYLQLHVHAHVYIIYVYIFSRSRKTHPGAVVHLSDNPLDLSKVRVFFEYVLFCIILHPYHDVIPYIF